MRCIVLGHRIAVVLMATMAIVEGQPPCVTNSMSEIANCYLASGVEVPFHFSCTNCLKVTKYANCMQRLVQGCPDLVAADGLKDIMLTTDKCKGILSSCSTGTSAQTCPGPTCTAKLIVVHRESNTLEYFQDGARVNKWDCVVGKNGATELGVFSILEKVKDKRSTKYNNAPMPFSLKFSTDWKAIHGTGLALVRSWAQYFGVDSVGSHGCVGLTNAQAETLFNWANLGTRIEIRAD